ncbi:CopD family protein [Dyella sp. LX-66]|uniref:CopD family protein n=1 Tax=unclassified Dyella TaxID=2634549 RepID=UPI001BE0B771|nr:MULTISPECIES: CopD family protein [unclassified Dyella]MBT2118771.1 CopD family protein [Dyella sp. LX-1]MBT2141120.1 CopD family protein [Dyella sp. LX-66]
MAYLWIKSLHLLFVMAWVASIFYLPRILVNIAEAGNESAVKARLELMGLRLYRFGHNMFGMALLFGATLWQGWRLFPGTLPNFGHAEWLYAKLTLVALLLAYYVWNGRLVKRSAKGGALPSAKTLRIMNELPVLVLLLIIFLVIAKPF